MSNETIEVIVSEGTPIQISGIPARIKGGAIVRMAPENVSLAFAAESTAAEDRDAPAYSAHSMNATGNTPGTDEGEAAKISALRSMKKTLTRLAQEADLAGLTDMQVELGNGRNRYTITVTREPDSPEKPEQGVH